MAVEEAAPFAEQIPFRELVPMLDLLLGCDRQIFVLLNNELHTRLLDVVMPFLTDPDNWKIPILVLVLALTVLGGRRGRWALGLALVSVAVADQVSSHWLKVVVARTRPCHVVEGVRLLVGCSGSFSFPSSHAANIAAAAFAFSTFYRRLWPLLLTVAFAVGYSRIYVGVHYPLDVLGGWVLGSVVALLLTRLWRLADRIWGIV